MDTLTLVSRIEDIRRELRLVDEFTANDMLHDILSLCDREVGWFGTADYTESVGIKDILRVMSRHLELPSDE